MLAFFSFAVSVIISSSAVETLKSTINNYTMSSTDLIDNGNEMHIIHELLLLLNFCKISS